MSSARTPTRSASAGEEISGVCWPLHYLLIIVILAAVVGMGDGSGVRGRR
ncbi:MAG: hypothetical protein WBP81_36135 [Solirubrobacteraceae bacterium]